MPSSAASSCLGRHANHTKGAKAQNYRHKSRGLQLTSARTPDTLEANNKDAHAVLETQSASLSLFFGGDSFCFCQARPSNTRENHHQRTTSAHLYSKHHFHLTKRHPILQILASRLSSTRLLLCMCRSLRKRVTQRYSIKNLSNDIASKDINTAKSSVKSWQQACLGPSPVSLLKHLQRIEYN
jgi:hypothetical protein